MDRQIERARREALLNPQDSLLWRRYRSSVERSGLPLYQYLQDLSIHRTESEENKYERYLKYKTKDKMPNWRDFSSDDILVFELDETDSWNLTLKDRLLGLHTVYWTVPNLPTYIASSQPSFICHTLYPNIYTKYDDEDTTEEFHDYWDTANIAWTPEYMSWSTISNAFNWDTIKYEGDIDRYAEAEITEELTSNQIL